MNKSSLFTLDEECYLESHNFDRKYDAFNHLHYSKDIGHDSNIVIFKNGEGFSWIYVNLVTLKTISKKFKSWKRLVKFLEDDFQERQK